MEKKIRKMEGEFIIILKFEQEEMKVVLLRNSNQYLTTSINTMLAGLARLSIVYLYVASNAIRTFNHAKII